MVDTVIRLRCPNLECRVILAVPVTTRGRVLRCRACGVTIRVPATRPAPAPRDEKPLGKA